ncbi:hypothetical protein KFE25_011527 [Diacronema lutheri]|uniref:Uncharacterized protein n=2 Tax=Diacronema lutheri TaxID=2081491 RepID=A0A8J5XIW9_DIALT|nr:hypothetical protein KFE25_011527 [Diacronema lutheri]
MATETRSSLGEPIVASSFADTGSRTDVPNRDKGRKGQQIGEIGWNTMQPFRSELAVHGKRVGEFGKAFADPANQFLGLSGNQHFDRDVRNKVPSVDSKGFGYHVSAPMYKHVTQKHNASISMR